MRRILYRRILIVLAFSASVFATYLYINQLDKEGNQQVSTDSIGATAVIAGGMPIGIYMETDGILVLNTEGIEDKNGNICEPAKNLVREGDYITAIEGEKVDSRTDLIRAVTNLDDSEVILSIRRNEECFDVEFDAIEVENDEYKLGIWVRDSVQGLGTVTYIKANGDFGALGHGIHDADTDDLLEIESGRVYNINIVGVQKGESGNPGGLEGVIIYNSRNVIGTIQKNTEKGIYGNIEEVDKLCKNQEPLEICSKKDIELGDAVIRCAIDGEVKEYDIKIKSVDYFTRDENKGIVIEVVDEELIGKTGGIVQGMSGSPVIQNGRIVGAVTHVLVNDPTRGYGIFIENML